MIAARLLLSGLLLLILAASAWAQAPRVANAPLPGADFLRPGGAEPDTTDWRRYFPLEVGNQWQYRVDLPDGGTRYYGYDVVGDTLLEGEHYFMIRTCYYRDPILCTDHKDERRYTYVRYDPEDPLLLERIEASGNSYDRWWEPVPCLLDADFDTGPVPCAEDQSEYFVSGGYGYDYVLAPDTLRDVTHKRFDSIPTVSGVVAGIGVIWIQDVKNTGSLDVLIYARVGGEEYGERYFDFPTVSNEAPPEAETAFALSAYPNPFRERLTVSFSLIEPGPVAVEVVDMLGRVVRRQEVGWRGPEQGVLHIDVRGLRAGAYLVRVRMGSGVSVTRKVTKL